MVRPTFQERQGRRVSGLFITVALGNASTSLLLKRNCTWRGRTEYLANFFKLWRRRISVSRDATR